MQINDPIRQNHISDSGWKISRPIIQHFSARNRINHKKSDKIMNKNLKSVKNISLLD